MGIPLSSVGLPGNTATTQALVSVSAVLAILIGGELFTTGTEWLSEQFGLDESTTGSIVAALATTLPETLIPVLAIVGGSGASVGVGAILGGPVSLTTFGLAVLGVSALWFGARGTRDRAVAVDAGQTALDLRVFLLGFGIALVAGFLRGGWTRVAGLPLLGLYGWYLVHVVRGDGGGTGFEPEPLELGRVRGWFDPLLGGGDHRTEPSRALVLAQVALAAGLLLGGAHFFVEGVTWLATAVLDVPSIVVALLLAPLVSNVPENVDGVIWVREGEDALAVEQVTGTLAFQGTVVASLGVLFTPWRLSVAWGSADLLVATAGVLSLLTGGFVYRWVAGGQEAFGPRSLVGLGLTYAAFVAAVGYYALVG